MTTVAHACHSKHESNCYSLIDLELDDTQTQMLLSITRRHCKLAVEHGRVYTIPERRQIIEEIQNLKAMCDELIVEWRKDAKN
ncbi:hypothetical protein ACFC0X_23260 [Paenibacillus chitinolyticus]|uniref:hypothetical protein n=1 Tax=Paenibacillus chitinolyticus TaxID=79263 RepID=UPI0035DEB5CD